MYCYVDIATNYDLKLIRCLDVLSSVFASVTYSSGRHPDRRKRPNAQSLLRTLEGDASNLLQLDSVARRRLADLPEDAYQLGADPHHSLELYTEITAKYAHVEQDFPIFD